MPNTTKQKRELQKKFLDEYAKTLHIGKSCVAAGIHREQWRRWLESDQWFVEEVSQIEEGFCDEIEERMRNRIRGIEEKGNWDVTKYYLENRFAKRWAPKNQIEFAQKGPLSVQIIEEEGSVSH